MSFTIAIAAGLAFARSPVAVSVAVPLSTTEPSWNTGSPQCAFSLKSAGKRTRQFTEVNGVTVECYRGRKSDVLCIAIAPGSWPRLPFVSECTVGKQSYQLTYFAGGEVELQDGAPAAIWRVDGGFSMTSHVLPGAGWAAGEGRAVNAEGGPWVGVGCRVAVVDRPTLQLETTPEMTPGSGKCLLPGDRSWPLEIHHIHLDN